MWIIVQVKYLIMKNLRNSRIVAGLLTASILLGPVTPASAGTAFGDESIDLEIGGFLSDFDTSVILTGPAGQGGKVSLEKHLGLDPDQVTFRGNLSWRIAPHHRLMLGYYRYDRSSSAVLQKDVIWEFPDGDTVEFTAGQVTESSFDWGLTPVSYAWSFYRNDRTELSAQFGVHWFSLDASINGNAHVNGNPAFTYVSKSESVSGPLPVIGLHASRALTPNWLVGAHAQYFGLDYDQYSGELTDLRVHTEYRFTDHFGLGLGYTWYNFSVTEDGDRGYATTVDYTYNGLEAFVAFRF